MACLKCVEKSGDGLWKIIKSSLKANPQVRSGDEYKIKADIKAGGFLMKRYGRACLYQGNTVIAQSGSFSAKPGSIVSLKFEGRMPNNDLDLNISVIDELFGFQQTCQDAAEIYIRLAINGETTEDIEHIEDEDKSELMVWIEENSIIISITISIIGLILLMILRRQ